MPWKKESPDHSRLYEGGLLEPQRKSPGLFGERRLSTGPDL